MGSQYSYTTEWDKRPKSIMQFDRKISKQSVREVFDQLLNDQIPSLEDFQWVITQAAQYFKTLPNHVQLQTKRNDRFIMVGDMHGCFETVIRLFVGDQATQIEPLGFPGDIVDGRRNIYIFNGDLVDRGGSGYQIVFMLCLLCLTSPEYTKINRGNHESDMFGASLAPGMGHKYMFEIKEKFPGVDLSQIRTSVSELFCSLPICHTIDQQVLVVHGGVPMSSEVQTINPLNGQIQFTSKAQPYSLKTLDNLYPSRFQTPLLEDTPKTKNQLWHSFLWSYDRQPYAGEFMAHNGIKSIICSHTATPYHFITTLLPLEGGAEPYAIQSVTRGEDTFQKVQEFFMERPNLARAKLSMVEVFSSPTNQGQMFASVLNETAGTIDPDPLHWEYKYLGSHTDFRFIQPEQ
ncbi:Serine/threonine-protein_phosphatase [Hexamita inflata]|uniref:Serine/threonine-protein phosphatase n=1 Tax=Hexamita inflata TaxID=28002 RepID=A0AA86NDY7_9EUKA|nr:Serine/threonine-protein phosphatase [Hexamita inflata]CAI9937735.1 Serine/threonine-protein phosphatase [Hexamita inflata]